MVHICLLRWSTSTVPRKSSFSVWFFSSSYCSSSFFWFTLIPRVKEWQMNSDWMWLWHVKRSQLTLFIHWNGGHFTTAELKKLSTMFLTHTKLSLEQTKFGISFMQGGFSKFTECVCWVGVEGIQVVQQKCSYGAIDSTT